MCLAGYYYPSYVWACPLKGHVPIWRTAVVDCHRHSPQAYKCVCVCGCSSKLCRLPYPTLKPPASQHLPLFYPAKSNARRVLDNVLISSSDAKQKTSACCTFAATPPILPTPLPPPLHFIKTKSTKQKSQMQCWLYHLGPRRKKNKTSVNATL